LIETDQEIAVIVMKLANSAFYGLSGKVTYIQHAAVILEYKTLGELITIAGFSRLMGKN
jgi:HD-like signal output (HDOD) protein